MRTVLGFLFQFLFLSVSSAGFFIASNLVLPIKAVVSHQQSHIPRMSIRFTEFSPAFSALEDDYYVSDYEEEQIPEHVIAQELKPGLREITSTQKQKMELPSLKVSPIQLGPPVERLPTTWKTAGAQTNDRLSEEIQKQKNETIFKNQNIPHYWIQGKIELTQGLAITDPRDQLRVGWFVDGHKVRDGKVNFNDGTYESKVDRMEGELIAELVDRKGYVLGEAIVDLELLSKQRSLQEIVVKDVDIKLAPYSFGLNGQTVSVYHTPGSRAVVGRTEVQVGDHDIRIQSDEKGKVHEESISNHSTAVLAANRGQYREAILLSDLEKEQTFRMFPEKFINNFFDIIELDKKFRDLGVIWGTVRKEDVPAPGHRLRIAGHPEVPVVYFSYYIADEKRHDTSTDGQFAFVGMLDGEYEVEVVDALDKKIDSKIVVVRAGAVSVAEFEIGTRKTLYVKPFDPFSQTPKNLELVAMGSDDVIATQTEDVLRLPVTRGSDPVLLYTKLDKSQVESSTFASRSRKFQEVPVLNAQWWAGIQAQYKINLASGVVIGFIDSDSTFQVFNEESGTQTKILYFNHLGQIISQPSQKASGFVIYGTGQGMKTLVIESNTGLITTEAAFVDGSAISLIYKSL